VIPAPVKDVPSMQLETARFGVIDVDNDTIIHFPLGLLGFERYQRYILIDSDEAEPMRWLQCVDDGALAFLVVEPGLFFADYAPPLSRDDRDFLQLADGEDYILACLVVIPDDPLQMTINLMGPLVLNADKRLGKQVVLHDSAYSTRQRLIPDTTASEAAVPV
jgi:flagellar assembly factor FliW